MRCEPFEQAIKTWLENAGNEQVKNVRTFDEAGFAKPFGLEIEARDGWTTFVQFVRTSPPKGDDDGWAERPEYRIPLEERRKMAPARSASRTAAPPTLRLRAIEALLKRVIVDAAHPGIVAVQTYAEAKLTTKPVGLKVVFTDDSWMFAMVVGMAPPGANRFNHPDYQPAKELI